jgi:DNA-binding winged helix-turn-helix (wHTH) protein/Tfp pilus assembly protein PilF
MSTPDRLAFGDFMLDRSQRRLLRRDGSAVALTPRLFNALLLFVESDGRLVDKDTLMRSLWPRLVVEENNLSQVISGLRHALGDAPKESRYLVTVPRVGFRFVAPVHAIAGAALPATQAMPAVASPPAAPPEISAAQRSRRRLLASTVAAAGAVAAAAWWAARRMPQSTAIARQTIVPAQQPPVAADGGTRNSEAYQLYAAALWRSQFLRRDDLDRALQLLHQAVALDPGFAMAWVAIARVHRRGLSIDTRPADVFVPAEAALRRAAALAPGLAEVLAGRGFSSFLYKFDWSAAERDFRAALAANPNAAVGHFGLAQLRLTQGLIAEGVAHLRQALELDPESPLFNIVAASYLTDLGHHAEAQRRLNVVLTPSSDAWPTYVVLGKLRLAEGRLDDAIAALRRATALNNGSSRPQAVLGVQLAAVGQADETRQQLAALEAHSRSRFVLPTSIASLHTALGQVGPALDALEQALAVRDPRVVFLKDDPHWRALHPEPRFTALLKRLGLDRFGPGLSQA